MKTVITISLLVVMLSVSGFAFAAISQPGQSSVIVDQPAAASCLTPATATTITGYRSVFAGPKIGWLQMPVYEQTLTCCQTFK
jgi:hypothetical protein